MKTKNTLAVGALALPLLLGAGAMTASAYQGDYTVQGPMYDEDRHEAMEAAFENLDYDAWLELMDGRGRITDIIDSEEDFELFAEAHEAAEEGDYDTAAEIREELGLGNGAGMGAGCTGEGNGTRGGRGMGYRQNQG